MPHRRATLLPGALWVVLVPLAAARAAVSIYVSPEGVSAVAPMAFEATVLWVDSGYDPVTARIATYVTLEASRVLRGPLSPGRIVLREPGGTFGDLVHVADGAPAYEPGETVVVFAEPSRDGALRTVGGFFGRFVERPAPRGFAQLERRLDGRGTILRQPGGLVERFSRDDILRFATDESRSAEPARFVARWLPEPEEFERLIWNRPAAAAGKASWSTMARALPDEAPPRTEFAPLSPGNPARWDEMDTGGTVFLNVERARDPLGDPAAAVAEIGRAVDAWTSVPESRAVVRLGNTDLRFTATSLSSPADVYPSANVILFGDPYDDLTEPVSCTGTVAYGGYWRAATASRTVNGVLYYPIRRSYLIFNRGFECFLGSPLNLAEIAAHEIGHGLGFGHSSSAGAIMRAWPYGGRGAVLDSDDKNAAHCVYPHSLTLVAPNGGETWAPGSLQTVRWSGTSDGGADLGTVDLELSVDAGVTWSSLATATPNDGSFDWSVPARPGSSARVRVVRRTTEGPGVPGGVVCSQDLSNGTFTISPPQSLAGSIGEGGAAPLVLSRATTGEIELSWGAPCGEPTGYAVYEGTLSALREGLWDHAPIRCGGADALAQSINAGGSDRYYLVGAVASVGEGSLGSQSDGTPRPESPSRCAARTSLRCP